MNVECYLRGISITKIMKEPFLSLMYLCFSDTAINYRVVAELQIVTAISL